MANPEGQPPDTERFVDPRTMARPLDTPRLDRLRVVALRVPGSRSGSVALVLTVATLLAVGAQALFVQRQARSLVQATKLDHDRRRKQSTVEFWSRLSDDRHHFRTLLRQEFGDEEPTTEQLQVLFDNRYTASQQGKRQLRWCRFLTAWSASAPESTQACSISISLTPCVEVRSCAPTSSTGLGPRVGERRWRDLLCMSRCRSLPRRSSRGDVLAPRGPTGRTELPLTTLLLGTVRPLHAHLRSLHTEPELRHSTPSPDL